LSDLQERGDKPLEQEILPGEQGLFESAIQVAGKVGAGIVLDFLGEVAVSAGRGLASIAPDAIKDPLVETATKAGFAILDSEIGERGLEAAREGIDSYQAFAAENPQTARTIESLTNIALLTAPVKGSPKKGPGPLRRLGEKLDKSAARAVKQNKRAFAADLVRPKQTKAVRVDQVGRTTEGGLLRSKKVALSPEQKAAASEVAKIKGVSPKLTLQGNYNVISDTVSKEATKLASRLSGLGNAGKFSKEELTKQLDDAVAKLIETSPAITGDAARTAEKMVRHLKTLIPENPTLADVLKARKQFDRWMFSQRGPNIFDPRLENAMSLALREIRGTTNSFISAKAPQVGVKQSLRKQSLLLGAMDDLAVKAADEANNAILRAWQKVLRLLPLRGEFNQSAAALFGVGGLGASARFAPTFTKLAALSALTYAGGKAALRPGGRKALGNMLGWIDDAIKVTTDKNVIRDLRADRAAIVELLKIAEERIESESSEETP
jgi:hypothetical protein